MIDTMTWSHLAVVLTVGGTVLVTIGLVLIVFAVRLVTWPYSPGMLERRVGRGRRLSTASAPFTRSSSRKDGGRAIPIAAGGVDYSNDSPPACALNRNSRSLGSAPKVQRPARGSHEADRKSG